MFVGEGVKDGFGSYPQGSGIAGKMMKYAFGGFLYSTLRVFDL